MSIQDLKDSGKGFFKFSLANILQLIIMLALLLNWYGNRESASAANVAQTTVLLSSHSERIKSLEDNEAKLSNTLTDLSNKVNVLVAIAEEERKNHK